MFCSKCGNKVTYGEAFCQNCGTRVEENHDLQSGNNAHDCDIKYFDNHSTPVINNSTQPANDGNELKWYLSIPFLFITLLLCFPVSIVLSIVRFTKTKGTERHRATLVYIICSLVVLVGIAFLMVSEEKTFSGIDTAIANGQYETAYTLIKQAERNNESSFRIKDSYIKYYEAQKLYNEAANVLIKYYEKDPGDSNFQNTIAQLNKMIELVSSEKKLEIQTFISDIENQKKILAEAKEREKAEKEEAKKAATEAKAREKAQKEAEKKAEEEVKNAHKEANNKAIDQASKLKNTTTATNTKNRNEVRPNGMYADYLGFTECTFRGDTLIIKSMGLPLGQWRFKIEGNQLFATAMSKGVRDAVYNYKNEGDIIYLDDLILYKDGSGFIKK